MKYSLLLISLILVVGCNPLKDRTTKAFPLTKEYRIVYNDSCNKYAACYYDRDWYGIDSVLLRLDENETGPDWVHFAMYEDETQCSDSAEAFYIIKIYLQRRSETAERDRIKDSTDNANAKIKNKCHTYR